MCVAGGDALKSVMHCKWMRTEQHCKMQQEKGPEAAKCKSQTKQEETGSKSTQESATRSSERPSELCPVSGRSPWAEKAEKLLRTS